MHHENTSTNIYIFCLIHRTNSTHRRLRIECIYKLALAHMYSANILESNILVSMTQICIACESCLCEVYIHLTGHSDSEQHRVPTSHTYEKEFYFKRFHQRLPFHSNTYLLPVNNFPISHPTIL